MKCINKWIGFGLCLVLLLSLTGCGGGVTVYEPYDLYEDSYAYGLTENAPDTSSNLMAKELCLTDGKNFGLEDVDSAICTGAGLFNVDTREVLYSQNIFDQVYPASTTKVLTAYIALTYGNLEQVITVSEHACDLDADSSNCELKPGDVLTLRQLLYGLMLRSGNDAAIAIAEGMYGSEEKFASVMNQEALKLGASHSHFVTPNGLHDEDHYTTVYDMYLIFNAAIKLQDFVEILQTVSYDLSYKDANGEEVTKTWANTCGYLSGAYDAPSGITVIGGKTGTTGQAKYCLVTLCTNARNERLISIVYHADSRGNLYYLMNEILYQFGGTA